MRVINREVLAHFVKHRGLSYAEIARRAHMLAGIPGPSKATIGHLVTGHVKVTKPEWAKAIERCLDAPPGSLFEATVSRVSENAA